MIVTTCDDNDKNRDLARMPPKEHETKMGRILLTSAHSNVVSVNANGLRKNRKKRPLRKLFKDLQVSLGIITETHLREEDLENFRIKGTTDRQSTADPQSRVLRSVEVSWSWHATMCQQALYRGRKICPRKLSIAHAFCTRQKARLLRKGCRGFMYRCPALGT